MSAPFRMMTTLTSVMLVIAGIFFLFLNTSLDDQRSSSLRQIATVNLNRKAVRKLPTTDSQTNQKILSHYSLTNTGTTISGWEIANAQTVYAYEEAVWEQMYARFGDKLGTNISQKTSLAPTYNGYSTVTRTRTWLYNGNAKGTLIFSYLYKTSLDDVYAVKVQAIVSGRAYTTNLAIIHDTNNNNFGTYSGSPSLNTPVGTMSSNDHKSGDTIAKTYTTDTGYNIIWDTEFTQALKFGMDHMRLTYTFNQTGQSVTIPSSLNQIYSNQSTADVPVKIMQATDSNEPFKVAANQIAITNSTSTNPQSKIVVTLTKAQSEKFFNLNYNSQQKMLFRVYTHISNMQVSSDYASGQAKLETLNSSNTVIQTQTADMSKVRITPFSIQPIDTGVSLANSKVALTHFVNKLYATGSTDATSNNTLAQAQYSFARAGNDLQQ